MPRPPVVSGVFYEDGPEPLEQQVRALLGAPPDPFDPGRTTVVGDAVAVLAPHAGYAFSGGVAGRTYARVPVPERVVILAPNHTGLGHPAAVGLDSPWETPIGPVPVDRDLARRVIRACPDLEADDLAHAEEHAIEVHLPFLKVRRPTVRIVPVCLRTMSYPACESLGQSLAAVLGEVGEPVLVVASTDLNHHEPLAVAARKDRMVLDRVQDLDARGLYQAVVTHHISMCGFVPSVVVVVASRALGACHAEVVGYATSADVDGDEASVVGYAGVILSRTRPAPAQGSLTGARRPGPMAR